MNDDKLPVFRLERVYLETETLGSIYGSDGKIICKTLELPFKDNKNNISCIPENLYIVVKMGPGFGRDHGYFRFLKVTGRNMNKALTMSTILIHRVNFVKDLKGCIGVGGRHEDINKDGIPDVAGSSIKLEWMVKNLPDRFKLNIIAKS